MSACFFPGEEFEYERISCGWCINLPLCALAAAALLLGLFPAQLLGWLSGLAAGIL